MHFLMHAWSHPGTDFDGFGGRKWSQVGTKVARKSKMVGEVANTKKYYKNQCQNKNFGYQGGPFWKKIGWKFEKKLKCKWEGVLMSIFNYFLSILAPKLGSKIEEKSTPKVLKKVMEKALWQRWVKSRNLNPEGCPRPPIQVPGEDSSFHGG